MRSAFVECPQKFFWEYLQHYKPLSPNIHLHAGKAWAAALEAARLSFYRDNDPEGTAFQKGLAALVAAYGDFDCPPYVNKSLPRLIEALTYYFTAFPLASDHAQPYMGQNGPMVEFSFALPLDAENLLHPVTGEPIIFVGRADMIATYAGAVSMYDDKTTSALGSTWAAQWDRRAQFSGYIWAAQSMGIPVTQALIRGIAIKKTSIDHAQAVSVRTHQHIEEWHTQIIRDISRAKKLWLQNYWDKNLADACNSYGGCIFRLPCGANDPQPWLDSTFKILRWDPVNREETSP